MKWLNWFKANPGEEERYKMFRARLMYELEQQEARRALREQRTHEKAMEEAYGSHGQG